MDKFLRFHLRHVKRFYDVYLLSLSAKSTLKNINQLRISKPSYEHFRGLYEFPNQNLSQIGPGVPELRSDKTNKHTNKQTDKQRLQLYIYRLFGHLFP